VKAPIVGFLEAARAAGIRISVAESIDTFRALECVGFADRAVLKDTLGVVLAKSREEKALFEACFELYFSRDGFEDKSPSSPESDRRRDGKRIDDGSGEPTLAQMLLQNDRAGLAVAMERAGNRAGVASIRVWTQANMFALRVLEEMGLPELNAEIERLRAEADPVAAELERARDELRERVRAFVERSLALAAAGDDRRWRDDFLKSATLWNVDRRDAERMRVLVRAMAKRLATRYGRDRRRRRRGRLDVRRTLRRNSGHDGVPFVTAWKHRKIEKPRVLALCDVSGSVAPVAHFLLLFLYSLNEALREIRSFAFSTRLIEVGEILEHEPIENAIAQIMQQIGLGSSDYGRSLADFAELALDDVDRHTSVIIMGDARSNYANPRSEILKTIYGRAKRVIWLNPESSTSWGTGDSEMHRYRPYCHLVRECRTLRDLDRTMNDLLAGAR
jgi:hypothetical protein